ncbi:MAG: DeoR/GlpR family DNA-binding transcription regulator [Candidatus Caldatribacteriota bacterium]|nr:DeoR/GlpR family DNA-binding transcription regulator [Candidatus Caldatribacteriota bacterium]
MFALFLKNFYNHKKERDDMAGKNYRTNYILNRLSVDGFANIKDLAKRLEVSEMTVRRDLRELSKENIVTLIPGGAVLKRNSPIDTDEEKYLIQTAESLMLEEKIKISRKAASLVAPNDVIIIDTGSTTENLPKFIPENIPLTIICYTLNILFNVYENKNWKLIFPGGYFHDDTLMFERPEGIDMIKKIRANKAFISAAGVSEKLGVTCATDYEKETKKAVIESSDTKILLVDSSKFGKVKISHFADLTDFDIVITDSGISKECEEIIKNIGVKLYII